MVSSKTDGCRASRAADFTCPLAAPSLPLGVGPRKPPYHTHGSTHARWGFGMQPREQGSERGGRLHSHTGNADGFFPGFFTREPISKREGMEKQLIWTGDVANTEHASASSAREGVRPGSPRDWQARSVSSELRCRLRCHRHEIAFPPLCLFWAQGTAASELHLPPPPVALELHCTSPPSPSKTRAPTHSVNTCMFQ